MKVRKKHKKDNLLVTYGGWYQRTGLHLDEIYNFLRKGEVNTNLPQDEAKELYLKMDVISVLKVKGLIDKLEIRTKNGIGITYYEDGLYLLTLPTSSIDKALSQIRLYYYHSFLPAINFIFSRGAPLPGALVKIHSEHPYVIFNSGGNKISDTNAHYMLDVESEVRGKDYRITQTSKCFLINYRGSRLDEIKLAIETLIFTNDFHIQLHRYLDIHRDIWETVKNIRDKVIWSGKDLDMVRITLDSFEQKLSLIENRVNQMGTVFATRDKYINDANLDEQIKKTFVFELSTLSDSLEYIKELLIMTDRFVVSAIEIVKEQLDKITSTSIDTLRLITTLGVVASLISYITIESKPRATSFGFIYFLILIIASVCANMLLQKAVKHLKHKVSFSKETLES